MFANQIRNNGVNTKFDRNDFANLERLFSDLGYGVQIKWYRKRLEYDWDDIIVCMDDRKGYGCIIELEKMTNEDEKDKYFEDLVEKMKSLAVKATPKKDFQKQLAEYILIGCG